MPSAGPRQLAQRAAFGRRVRKLRVQHGLSQEELAHLSELDRSYVGGIERGERNVGLDNIHRVANALGVQVADLFTRDGEESAEQVVGVRA